jgi:hypothetical protein
MTTPTSSIRLARGPALALAIALIAFAVGYRLLTATMLPGLPNFCPIMALALCGALVLPGSLAMLVPLAALVGTDLLLNLHYGVAPIGREELLRYACYGLGVATGLSLRQFQAGAPATLGAVAGNSLLFYLVTNSASWLSDPTYAKSAAGWWQALTIGVPGFPPTWVFLRNSLVSDLLFTAGFLVVLRLAARQPQRVAVPARPI